MDMWDAGEGFPQASQVVLQFIRLLEQCIQSSETDRMGLFSQRSLVISTVVVLEGRACISVAEEGTHLLQG